MGLRGLIVAIAFATLAILVISNAKAQTFDANGNGTQIIGRGAPSGCPFRRFCACAAAKYLGLDNKGGKYNLAWAWTRLFPRRDHPAPGYAAVRPGHLMLLIAHVSGNKWLTRDYNSGGGLSRIHVRSVRGFVFVDPSQRHAGL